MGRLFWKFFFIFWLAQFVTAAGVGTAIWILRPQHFPGPGLVVPGPPPPEFSGMEGHPPPHRGPPMEPGMSLPLLPIAAGSLVSLLFAGLLAWYFARPIRLLRGAFAAVASGEIDTRVGPAMGGRNDELADLGKNFDDMAGRLGDLLLAQRNLLHDVSHELRSPMARLQAAAELIRQQPERGAELAERIVRDTERMDRLIGELLTLARLDSGIQDAIPESVDLREVIADIAENARIEADERGCTIDLALIGEPRVPGDCELLHRAIENLVRNAVLHSPQGGPVSIGASAADGICRITVADRGPGVPEAHTQAIFDPFFRSSIATSSSGYGLGLAITRRIAEKHGGRAFATNRPKGGLLLTIELPIGKAPF
jgi:two-component system OmpR family sensor kinase